MNPLAVCIPGQVAFLSLAIADLRRAEVKADGRLFDKRSDGIIPTACFCTSTSKKHTHMCMLSKQSRLVSHGACRRFKHTELVAEEASTTLVVTFARGRRLRSRDAVALQVARLVEEQVGTLVGPVHLKETLLAMGTVHMMCMPLL